MAIDSPPEKQGYFNPFRDIGGDGRESSTILPGNRTPEFDQDRSGRRVGLPYLEEKINNWLIANSWIDKTEVKNAQILCSSG